MRVIRGLAYPQQCGFELVDVTSISMWAETTPCPYDRSGAVIFSSLTEANTQRELSFTPTSTHFTPWCYYHKAARVVNLCVFYACQSDATGLIGGQTVGKPTSSRRERLI